MTYRQDILRLLDMQATVEQLLRQVTRVHDDMGKLLAEMQVAEAPAGPTIYCQRQADWANIKLGKSIKWTIGISGCLISAFASCLTDAGKPMNPAELNAWLVANNGFTADSEGQIVNFIFSRPDKLGVLKFDGLTRCEKVAAPMIQIDQAVQSGYVIVMVHRSGVPQHWVRYLDNNDGKGKIMDPYFGDVSDLLPRYTGANLAEAILAAAYYKKAG